MRIGKLIFTKKILAHTKEYNTFEAVPMSWLLLPIDLPPIHASTIKL